MHRSEYHWLNRVENSTRNFGISILQLHFDGSVVIFNKSLKSYKKKTKYEHLKTVLVMRLHFLQMSKYNVNTAIYKVKILRKHRGISQINWQPNCRIITIKIKRICSIVLHACRCYYSWIIHAYLSQLTPRY